ncbi:helix-turn-helix transcriptional regulator [Kibdelosporangium persicum]|uniref:DNA binding protein with helix-turn-helix domain n=1 Tax=Kibdelosporangium persicum TaxID=2698649 RepID=A0ABX2FCW9_9PSEU|nr:helix-turn-helix transcriptional regulator [Kibdelosporangium persicum]NRN69063.1 DNA binding protein with helix-turn-helix domain [Kibdelosporangium persicum]
MSGVAQTIPRRLLGSELKRLRLRAGKSGVEAAAAINKDQSRISKVEDGRANLSADDLATLLDLFGVSKAERKKLLAMGVEARKREPKRRAYVDTLPGSYRRLSNMEVQASRILSYEKGIFPGLLQCDDYAEAVITACDGVWWESSYQDRANRVSFRLDRQRLVFQADPAKELEFIITDDALQTPFGRPHVLRRQIEHVLQLIDEHPKLSIHVLSATIPDNPAPQGGFALMHFPEPAPPIGFMSVLYGPSPYLDDAADTDALIRAFERLREMSSGKAESRVIVERFLTRS